MPLFSFHLRHPTGIEPDDSGLECRSLHHAYLEACRSIPDLARDLLAAGRDPMNCAFLICDARGRQLMEVPFEDVLSPREWRLRRAARPPHRGARSSACRDDLALASFRRMFANLDVGCVLLNPELEVRDMNTFGAAHSHVDAEAIRGRSILDIFDLTGQPRSDFETFMRLAQQGAESQVVDLPYYVLDADGQTAHGWWNARLWPIFDYDSNLLGLVEWAEPHLHPTARGQTIVRLRPGSTA